MKFISLRAQLGLVALGYAAFAAIGARLLYERHLQELRNPADVAASGGMYAGGDLLLGIFIACLLMIPTVFLIWILARFEAFYTAYATFLLVLSLSAPVCLSLFLLDQRHLPPSINTFCLYRLLASPMVLAGIVVSRLVARFDRAKKLTFYALLIEGSAIVVAVALLFHAAGSHSR